MLGPLHLVFLASMGVLVGALMTGVLVDPLVKLARAMDFLDRPDRRHDHARSVPRIGGVAISLGLLLGAGTGVALAWTHLGPVLPPRDLFAVALVAGILLVAGLADDISGLSAWRKLLVQVAGAIVMVGIGWQFTTIALPSGAILELGMLGPVLTVLWIVGVTNAINLIDGFDGLAAGVVAIIAASLLVFSIVRLDPLGVVVLAAVLGSCTGFLRHNWEPARIFMGDSGSLMLGFVLAATSVRSSIKASAAAAILIPLLVLGVPVIDTLLVMAVRFLKRSKSSFSERVLRVFRADRNHLHHLLEYLAPNRKAVVGMIYGLVLVSCLASLVVVLTQDGRLGWVTIVVEVAAIGVMRSLGMRKKLGLRAAAARRTVVSDIREARDADRRLRPAAILRADPFLGTAGSAPKPAASALDDHMPLRHVRQRGDA